MDEATIPCAHAEDVEADLCGTTPFCEKPFWKWMVEQAKDGKLPSDFRATIYAYYEVDEPPIPCLVGRDGSGLRTVYEMCYSWLHDSVQFKVKSTMYGWTDACGSRMHALQFGSLECGDGNHHKLTRKEMAQVMEGGNKFGYDELEPTTPEEVVELCTIEGNQVHVPSPDDVTIPKELYAKFKMAMMNLGGQWKGRKKAFEFPTDPAPLIAEYLDTGKAVRRKTITQAFYTPEALVAEMVDALPLETDGLYLEPSAGDGRIILRMLEAGWSGSQIHFCELQEEERDSLADHYQLRGSDFMEFLSNSPAYRGIIMNPPFTKNQDAKHILHAWRNHLQPGGTLVAIASANCLEKGTGANKELKRLMEEAGAEVTQIPAGTFKESGTGVATIMIVAKKP